jgi:hypothetical protein
MKLFLNKERFRTVKYIPRPESSENPLKLFPRKRL